MSGRKVTNNFCLTSTEHLLFYTVKAPLKMTIRMNYPTEDKTNFNSQSLIRCKWYLQKKKKDRMARMAHGDIRCQKSGEEKIMQNKN